MKNLNFTIRQYNNTGIDPITTIESLCMSVYRHVLLCYTVHALNSQSSSHLPVRVPVCGYGCVHTQYIHRDYYTSNEVKQVAYHKIGQFDASQEMWATYMERLHGIHFIANGIESAENKCAVLHLMICGLSTHS